MGEKIIRHTDLRDFGKNIFMNLGASEDAALYTADNLVMSNLRGIDSHGVSRMMMYVGGINAGYIDPKAQPHTVKESYVLARVDAQNGLGQHAGVFGMDIAIKKAQETGIGVVSVHNSNHFGFAGYYSMMALEHDLIGVSMTNSTALVVPTFGRTPLLGTNPISIAVPVKRNLPWVMDLATSIVSLGTIQDHEKADEPISSGWVTDETGASTSDPSEFLRGVFNGTSKTGLFPLGGEGEEYGGHKGYGLAAMIEILCGVLPGASFCVNAEGWKDTGYKPPNIGHFFVALDPSFFIDLDEFKERMDIFITTLRNSDKAANQPRIFIHGEKEFEEHKRRIEKGVPIDISTQSSLLLLSEKYNVPLKWL